MIGTTDRHHINQRHRRNSCVLFVFIAGMSFLLPSCKRDPWNKDAIRASFVRKIVDTSEDGVLLTLHEYVLTNTASTDYLIPTEHSHLTFMGRASHNRDVLLPNPPFLLRGYPILIPAGRSVAIVVEDIRRAFTSPPEDEFVIFDSKSYYQIEFPPPPRSP